MKMIGIHVGNSFRYMLLITKGFRFVCLRYTMLTSWYSGIGDKHSCCTQTRSQFILLSKGVVGSGDRNHVNSNGKIPSTGCLRGGSNLQSPIEPL